jgi:ribokinase
MLFSNKPKFYPKYLVAGKFSRDFVIPISKQPKMDYLGGNAAYTAAGLALWDKPVGILSRIGEDYPREWLNKLLDHEIDIRGVKIILESIDLRTFYGYQPDGTYQKDGSVGSFADIEHPFPLALLNYKPEKNPKDDLHTRQRTSPLSTDIPHDYLDAIAAHLCPMDFITQSLLQSVLHAGNIRTITLEANPAYLLPQNWNEIPNVVSGLTCFMVEEKDIRQFFRSRSNDLVEMAAAIGKMGSEFVIIRLEPGGVLLYQHSSNLKWEVPQYPVKRVNAHSARHAFCGGFLAGYIQSYDPVIASVKGVVSESMASEALYPLDLFEAMTGLAQAREGVVKELVRSL